MLPLPSSDQCYYAVAFSPCGRWIAAGGSARCVDVWDLHAPEQAPKPLGEMPEPIVRLRFTDEGHLVTYAMNWHCFDEPGRWTAGKRRPRGALQVGGAQTNNALEYLEVRSSSGEVVDRLPVSPRPLRVEYSANGERAATLTNGNLSVWDLRARSAVVDRNGPVHGGWLSLAFAPHGRRVVTGGITSTVATWDALAPGPPLTTFEWGVGPVYAVAFDRDGLRAAAAGHSGVIVWDVDE